MQQCIRFLFSALIASILSVGCTAGPHPLDATPIDAPSAVANSIDATVVLLKASSEEPEVLCGGQFISAFALATAEHCVEHAIGGPNKTGGRLRYLTRGTYEAVLRGAEDFQIRGAELVWWDAAADLALFIADDRAPAFVWPRRFPPKKGDKVYSVGHPDGVPWAVRDGYVTMLSSDTVYTSIRIYFGSSGGGLYDAEGRLVGVASRMSYGGEIGYWSRVDGLLSHI